MGAQFGEFAARGVSPAPLLALAAAILYGVWAKFSQASAKGVIQ
jgi:hypothetical protein